MRETFELLGRQMTVLDLTGPASAASGPPGPSGASVPLRWSMGDGVVLDLRAHDGGAPIGEQACREQLDRIGYRLKPYDIVIVRLGHRGSAPPAGGGPTPALGGAAVAWILQQGVRVIGLDTPPGAPAPAPTAGTVAAPRSAGAADGQYRRIDGLRNLHRLPGPHGFTVLAIPAAGAHGPHPSRVIALYDGV